MRGKGGKQSTMGGKYPSPLVQKENQMKLSTPPPGAGGGGATSSYFSSSSFSIEQENGK